MSLWIRRLCKNAFLSAASLVCVCGMLAVYAGQATTGGGQTTPPAASDPAAAAKLQTLQNALTAANGVLTKAKADRDSALALLNSLPGSPPTLSTDSVDTTSKALTLLADKTKVSSPQAIADLDTRLKADLSKTDPNGLTVQSATLKAALDATAGIKPQLSAGDQTLLTTAQNAAAAAGTDMEQTLDAIKSKILPDENSGVVKRIQGVDVYAKSLVDLITKSETGNALTKLDANAKAADVRAAFLSGLRDLLAAEKVRFALIDAWKAAPAAFNNALTGYQDDVTPGLTALATGIEDKTTGLLVRFDPWLRTLASDALSETTQVGKSAAALADTLSKPQRDLSVVATANNDHNTAGQQFADLNNLLTDLTSLFAFWEGKTYKANLAQAERSNADVAKARGELATQTALLGGLLQGDQEHFVADQVRLFYFTDVPRLIKAINPDAALVTNADIQAAQQKRDNATAELLTDESAIASLTEEINQHQQRVRDIQEQIRLANAQLADARNREQALQTRVNVLQRQTNAVTLRRNTLTSQQQQLTDENTTLASQQMTYKNQLAALDPNDPMQAAKSALLQQQIRTNQRQQDSNNRRLNALALQLAALPTNPPELPDQQAALANAQAGDATIQQQITELNANLDKLNPDLAKAKEELIDAQVRRAGARRTAALMAQQEAEAFGQARDNQPFWMAKGNVLSNDPALRTILYGYADSSVIFIRGLARDVERVKEIISAFDRPAPQARITLYTLQMNGNDNQRINEALKNVDDILRDVRGSIVLVQDKLRDSVNEEVRLKAKEAYPALNRAFLTANDRERMARYYYYAPEVSRALGYDPELVRTAKLPASAFVTLRTLPDPAHATTLGETLFVLSLGRYDSRIRILGRFVAAIYKEYTVLQVTGGKKSPHYGQVVAMERFLHAVAPIIASTHHPQQIDTTFDQALQNDPDVHETLKVFVAKAHKIPQPDPSGPVGGYPHFFITVLGGDVSSISAFKTHELTPNQLEILTALQAKARENVSAEVRSLIRQIDRLPEEDRQGANSTGEIYRRQYMPLVGWLHNRFYRGENPKNLTDDTLERAGRLAVHYTDPKQQNPLQADLTAYSIAETVRDHNSLSKATARVAAADDMIKRLITVAEDDIDYFFISPALAELRRQVRRSGVELGTLQRESILATNREIARVDPRATATLSLDQGTNVLNSAQQLGQIAAQFRETQRAAKLQQTLPAFGAGIDALVKGSNAGSALAYGGLLSLLGNLVAQPQDPPGEIYSVNSGNTFKVTPIFDPSGQALRFKFDFVAQTQVQEPNGTTTPDLSRVDRHTVNTDVQLTNLEIREISRFEANSKLGVPAVRQGGLPVINQIPILRDIPILGYYYHRRAQKASRQESLIFAQTSLYPTIGDLMDLLTDVPVPVDLGRELPAYLSAQPTPEGTLKSLTFDPSPVVTGNTTIGAVTLSAPAKQNTLIYLSSEEPGKAQVIEGQIMVVKGQSSAVFRVKAVTGSVTKPTPVAITAESGNRIRQITLLTVQPPDTPTDKPKSPDPGIQEFKMDASAPGGGVVYGHILFNDPPAKDAAKQDPAAKPAADAKPGAGSDTDLTLTLTTSSPSLTVPASIKYKVTDKTITFMAQAKFLHQNETVIVTATSPNSTKQAAVAITPVAISTVFVAPAPSGSSGWIVTVVLNGSPPPGDFPVKLSCSNHNVRILPERQLTVVPNSNIVRFRVLPIRGYRHERGEEVRAALPDGPPAYAGLPFTEGNR